MGKLIIKIERYNTQFNITGLTKGDNIQDIVIDGISINNNLISCDNNFSYSLKEIIQCDYLKKELKNNDIKLIQTRANSLIISSDGLGVLYRGGLLNYKFNNNNTNLCNQDFCMFFLNKDILHLRFFYQE
jgi:hypothetical protein